LRARVDEAWRSSTAACASASIGQLQEWKADLDDMKDDHRHVSHLFALHPGHAIDPGKNPELVAGGARHARCSRGRQHGLEPRVEDQFLGAPARRLTARTAARRAAARPARCPTCGTRIRRSRSTGNFGATAGIVEMLLSEPEWRNCMFAALPKAWRKGSVKGIRARGDVTVDIEWDSCGPVKLALTTGHARPVSVRSTMFENSFQTSVKTDGTQGLSQIHGRSSTRAGNTALHARVGAGAARSLTEIKDASPGSCHCGNIELHSGLAAGAVKFRRGPADVRFASNTAACGPRAARALARREIDRASRRATHSARKPRSSMCARIAASCPSSPARSRDRLMRWSVVNAFDNVDAANAQRSRRHSTERAKAIDWRDASATG
jgi:hypothetical protein